KTFSSSTFCFWLAMVLAAEMMASRKRFPLINLSALLLWPGCWQQHPAAVSIWDSAVFQAIHKDIDRCHMDTGHILHCVTDLMNDAVYDGLDIGTIGHLNMQVNHQSIPAGPDCNPPEVIRSGQQSAQSPGRI